MVSWVYAIFGDSHEMANEDDLEEQFKKIREVFNKHGVNYSTIEPEFILNSIISEENTDTIPNVQSASPPSGVREGVDNDESTQEHSKHLLPSHYSHFPSGGPHEHKAKQMHVRTSSRELLQGPSFTFLTLANLKHEKQSLAESARQQSLSPLKHKVCESYTKVNKG
jgi:hypothetical protein